ncbi:hypothetical protein A3A93_03330 [Candidatus Roizmanbacteria bacterium RIFCSPLOWO2_01_FULL_38_12]|uniref:DUF288 domain-containing protein n=1 Tax=Candidatus Roizmanbacteria bacterium RIFCSPLOWO2_01_FULL_38_12 TaxID=1802061 RepID=A0A1F7ISP2_9BACT|nr:MAG: hypothetical protein A2861_03995 [Candidatus Roizmanbacteria bacterium RIFCSPHIGHO2_01_FULL_38_15]OGK35806.1 MAG: hypothetical protein A3F59_03620 [Candidatus Roizmanbacteria bacterium RIFCSPHIGHO2_12_FULL_38_13]OGK46379.1 MAG: hypothetical protein A3A93_03330 [Candidatus Roizmanbacteria bacterium RIFCSPLOWO2_01_FULL_38_12]
MSTIPVIITTIHKPTASIKSFSKINNFKVYIVGDKKSPKDGFFKKYNFFSFKEQARKFPDFHKLIRPNHYSRKNFGYLDAVKSNPEFIYETDDDNLPYDFFPNFLYKQTKINTIKAGTFFNIYSVFTKKNIWPRGYPLSKIQEKKFSSVTSKKIFPYIQQSLADIDPDVDAIYRLTDPSPTYFKKNTEVALYRFTFSPFNSQNTLWHKNVFKLLYLPTSVNSRVCDIWRGYIAQRILWELNSLVIYTSPSVYQKRNVHNLMKDFTDEIDLYLKTEKLAELLKEIKLKGSIDEMLLKIYKVFAENELVLDYEIKSLKEWLKLLNKNIKSSVQ